MDHIEGWGNKHIISPACIHESLFWCHGTCGRLVGIQRKKKDPRKTFRTTFVLKHKLEFFWTKLFWWPMVGTYGPLMEWRTVGPLRRSESPFLSRWWWNYASVEWCVNRTKNSSPHRGSWHDHFVSELHLHTTTYGLWFAL